MGTPEDITVEKYFTPLEMDREIESLIYFWKDSLAQHRLLMSPSTVYLGEQTIKSLEELKQIKKAEISKDRNLEPLGPDRGPRTPSEIEAMEKMQSKEGG